MLNRDEAPERRTLTVRLDVPTTDRLRVSAQRHRRSLNGEVAAAIDEYLDADGLDRFRYLGEMETRG